MNSVATLVGLAVASTAAALVILIALANGQSTTNKSTQLSGNGTNGHWIDPNGPSVQFILFTRQYQPYNLRSGNIEDFRNSGINLSNPVKIIIHGFLSSSAEEIFVVNKNAYLETGDYNIFAMDWSVLCQFEYLSAVRGARIAGHYLGKFLNWLVQMGVPLKSIHLIGHSMGAHVAGIGGGNVDNGRVAKITGKVSESLFCNHGRAYLLFAESIRNKNAFKSRRCDSFENAVQGKCYEESDVYMGQSETYRDGIYYLKTRDESPYSFS
ncbi:endothelial lipase isoform X2 [Leptinotarsa decemlineata]|uniref:endothelial lipase isoform X2 n=1 Tax=Leptinotarsa decemlineata TaxID=7539 RepID=UPI003D309135